jgi:hypothetical protein
LEDYRAAGITGSNRIEALTRAGLEKDEIRTSCLGFGDSYNKAKIVLEACPAPELTSEAAALLQEHEQKIRSREIDSRAR